MWLHNKITIIINFYLNHQLHVNEFSCANWLAEGDSSNEAGCPNGLDPRQWEKRHLEAIHSGDAGVPWLQLD